MLIKDQRQEALRNVLTENTITSQSELLQILNKRGFKMTQATLSRDLQQLHVARLSTPMGKRYVLPENPYYRRIALPTNTAPTEVAPVVQQEPRWKHGYITTLYSKNVAVIKTRPGYAGALSAEIDAAELDNVLGTIAGDDTIMVILAENTAQEAFAKALHTIINI